MKSTFEISPKCLETYPCQHTCKIVLSDGREKSVTLLKPDISSLFLAIAREKIENNSSHKFNKSPSKDAASVLSGVFQ